MSFRTCLRSKTLFQRTAALLSLLTVSVHAGDAIVRTNPFVGDKSENLERITSTFHIDEFVDVFGGDVTFESLADSTTIHVWSGSCLGSDCSIPRSGQYLIGATTGQALVFNRPVTSFGAYFTNTSSVNNAVATFFGVNGALLGAKVVRVPVKGTGWRWNGFSSLIPIARIEIHGEGFLEGFIWLDDLEVTFAVAAACSFRNGNDVNPTGFSCGSAPVLGSSWEAAIDPTPAAGATTVGTALLLSLGGPTSGTFLKSGELLVLPRIFVDLATGAEAGTHAIPIPPDAGLVGVPLSTQGVRVELTPTLETRVVLLNAQDLVLGS